MRYEAKWLLECLLLCVKSLATYEHLRMSKILPLPHKDTLRKLISGMSCHFAFNQVALDAVEKILSGESDAKKLVVISFDEVAITPSLTFNTESLAFDGFVKVQDDPVLNRHELDTNDQNDGSEELLPKIDQNTPLADHALVFMVRPILAKWVQPFGVFALVGAASRDDLYKIVLAAILRLESKGARVLCAVSDGAATACLIQQFRVTTYTCCKILHMLSNAYGTKCSIMRPFR